MRLFDTLSEGERQIVRYQVKQYYAHARLFREEIIPTIPNDEDTEDEIIPRKPPTMQQQEEGFGYNEREFIGEEMPRSPGKPGPGEGVPIEHKRERKQKKRGAVRNRVGPRVRHQAQAPVVIGAAEIEPKRRPELKRDLQPVPIKRGKT